MIMTSNKNFAKFININGRYRFFNDDNDLIKIQQEAIDRLTNNWNELEEWLKSYIALFDKPDTLEEQTLEDLKEVLDKMKEIKGDKEWN